MKYKILNIIILKLQKDILAINDSKYYICVNNNNLHTNITQYNTLQHTTKTLTHKFLTLTTPYNIQQKHKHIKFYYIEISKL